MTSSSTETYVVFPPPHDKVLQTEARLYLRSPPPSPPPSLLHHPASSITRPPPPPSLLHHPASSITQPPPSPSLIGYKMLALRIEFSKLFFSNNPRIILMQNRDVADRRTNHDTKWVISTYLSRLALQLKKIKLALSQKTFGLSKTIGTQFDRSTAMTQRNVWPHIQL